MASIYLPSRFRLSKRVSRELIRDFKDGWLLPEIKQYKRGW